MPLDQQHFSIFQILIRPLDRWSSDSEYLLHFENSFEKVEESYGETSRKKTRNRKHRRDSSSDTVGIVQYGSHPEASPDFSNSATFRAHVPDLFNDPNYEEERRGRIEQKVGIGGDVVHVFFFVILHV